jgi:hypothetical protein
MEPTKHSRILKWSIIVGIVIVLNLFFNYALSLVYKAPEYNDFCPNEQVVNAPTTKDACVAAGGQWTENVYPPEVRTAPAVPVKTPAVTGYCNPNYTCQKSFDTASKTYERNVFVALVALGIISILIAVFWNTAGIVSIALSLGGVLSILIASVRYWGQAQNVLRVLILAIALIALIWVGVKKFRA